MQSIYTASLKGGSGKSTFNAVLAYTLEKQGYKVLVIDLDPQADLTHMLSNTYDYMPYKSLFDGMKASHVSHAIESLTDNLDIIAGNPNISRFNEFTSKVSAYQRHEYLDKLLAPIKENYDYILFDAPPTISDVTHNILGTVDYVVGLMESSALGIKSIYSLASYLNDHRSTLEAHYAFVAIVPYAVDKRSKRSLASYETAKEEVGDDLTSPIYSRDLIREFSEGIIDKNHHTRRNLDMYKEVFNEIIEKINLFEGND